MDLGAAQTTFSSGPVLRPAARALILFGLLAGCAPPQTAGVGPSRPPAPRLAAGSQAAPRARSTARIPVADLEPMERVVLAWPRVNDQVDAFMAELVTLTAPHVPITILVDSRRQRDAVRAVLRGYAGEEPEIEFVTTPLDSVWIRDYGPLFVREGAKVEAIDLPYATDRPADDVVPDRLSRSLHVPIRLSRLTMDGGHFVSDGEGRCVVTDDVLDRNVDEGLTPDLLAEVLERELGCRQVTIVPALVGEGTGHVDVMLFVTGPKRVLVGRYTRAEDLENAERLDLAAELLRLDGFEVGRVPMPRNDDRAIFRTYMNAIPLDGVLLVPVFREDRRHEAVALRAYVRAFPSWVIVPVLADDIIALEGSVHCTMIGVPRDRPPG
jgi:agmatine/peptidylarginine deiminase